MLNVLGMYPGDPGPPGSDCAGIVMAVGATAAQHFSPGALFERRNWQDAATPLSHAIHVCIWLLHLFELHMACPEPNCSIQLLQLCSLASFSLQAKPCLVWRTVAWAPW